MLEKFDISGFFFYYKKISPVRHGDYEAIYDYSYVIPQNLSVFQTPNDKKADVGPLAATSAFLNLNQFTKINVSACSDS